MLVECTQTITHHVQVDRPLRLQPLQQGQHRRVLHRRRDHVRSPPFFFSFSFSTLFPFPPPLPPRPYPPTQGPVDRLRPTRGKDNLLGALGAHHRRHRRPGARHGGARGEAVGVRRPRVAAAGVEVRQHPQGHLGVHLGRGVPVEVDGPLLLLHNGSIPRSCSGCSVVLLLLVVLVLFPVLQRPPHPRHHPALTPLHELPRQPQRVGFMPQVAHGLAVPIREGHEEEEEQKERDHQEGQHDGGRVRQGLGLLPVHPPPRRLDGCLPGLAVRGWVIRSLEEIGRWPEPPHPACV